METETSAGLIVFYMKNSSPIFLILQNTLKTTYLGFPKGKIEKGESIQETAIRETKEEVNISKLKLIPGFKHIQQWFYRLNNKLIKKSSTFLLAEIDEKEAKKAKINEENEKLLWLDYKEAVRLIKIKQNREMLTQAYKFIEDYKKQKTLI